MEIYACFIPVVFVALVWGTIRFFLYAIDSGAGRRSRHLLFRIRSKKCLGCGYDLRHSEWRCPECGRLRGGTPEQVAALTGMVSKDANKTQEGPPAVPGDAENDGAPAA